MELSRRSFLKRTAAGLIATATMAEAGAVAELMDWMRRKPVFSFAPYRPYDGPEVFVVTRVVKGIPVAFNGPYLPVDMTQGKAIVWTDNPPSIQVNGLANSNPAAIHTTQVANRKRPLPGFVREGDLIDYYDLRTMPPPSTVKAQAINDGVRNAIVSAYEAEQSGDHEAIARSMGHVGMAYA